MSEPFCSTLALEVGEPLAGTAAGDTDRYLVLEHHAPWGPKGVEDSQLPAAVVSYLHTLGKRRGLRVQLVRGEKAESHVRVYFANTGAEHALRSLTLTSIDDLPALDLSVWFAGGAAPGELESEPLYLVCTHGKRDRCCALLGLPVYRALLERVGSRALQTTHLGGHRFAATLLTLPAGICYGRVLTDETERLVEATEQNELYDLTRVRGRTTYGSEAQAAEVMLLERLGERSLSALELQRVDAGPTTSTVVFKSRDGSEHEVTLQREALPATPNSCGAAPKPVTRLVRA